MKLKTQDTTWNFSEDLVYFSEDLVYLLEDLVYNTARYHSVAQLSGPSTDTSFFNRLDRFETLR